MDKMKIGIDLDNTVTASHNSIAFFSFMTQMCKSQALIYIITAREENNREETIQELKELGIHYDYLFITSNKYKVIMDNDINILFEDTDEFFQDLPEKVTVFKIREDGNFDFSSGKWIYGNKTGLNIDR